jgi:tripartite-type tricarboxylate transporter receptor subunit TctC
MAAGRVASIPDKFQEVSMPKVPVRRALLACGLAAALLPCGSQAQAYPSKTVRIIVPYAAGGGTDLLARVLAEKLSARWGVAVIVENRAGAAGRIGTEAVARAAPDGYTMLMAINSHALNASLFSKLPYDPIKDFAPVIWVASSPNVVTVHPGSSIHSMADLLAQARAHPGVLTYASGGPASGSNLAGELLKLMGKVSILEVPYKGAAPAMQDLLAGQVTMSFVVLTNALPSIQAGKLRALAVTSKARSAFAPDIPTVSETVLEGYDVFSWYGLLAPAGTPREIVQKWNADVTRTMQLPEVKDKLAKLGMETRGGTPEEFGDFIRTDWALWDKVVKSAGIKAE